MLFESPKIGLNVVWNTPKLNSILFRMHYTKIGLDSGIGISPV